MEVKIRPAEKDDAPSLAGLMTELGYPTTPEEMARRLDSILRHPDYHTLLAEVPGGIAGMAGLQVSPSYERNRRVGRITALSVTERLRGEGIGRRLLEEAEAWFRRRGAERIVVTSALHRVEAHRFYAGLGYEKNGVRLAKSL